MTNVSAQLISISEVVVDPERQRRSFDEAALKDLADSIQRHGVLQPIILREGNLLVAGERRLRASKLAGQSSIPFIRFEQLSALEARIIELEENVKRENLTWQEQTEAIKSLHESFSAATPEWTLEKTAAAIGFSVAHISKFITVAEAAKADPKLMQASGISSAYNFVSRQRERAAETELAKLMVSEAVEEAPSSVVILPKEEPFSIIQGNFLTWEPGVGTLFNLLHCDFPYGVDMGTANLQTSSKLWEKYGDEEATYFQLIERLGEFQKLYVAPSAHMIFWFSMKFYRETVTSLESLGWTVDPFPLVWHKSDNKGLLPDPQRGPRRVYETALLCSRGDRKIVRPVANTISAPTNKSDAIHISEKPDAVVSHFLTMLVDQSTSLFDPTAGGGSAIGAAKRLGAERAVGLELSASHVAAAQARLLRGTAVDALIGDFNADHPNQP